MTHLIDADALVDAIKNRIEKDREIYPNFSRFSRVGMRIVIGIIKNQDTVDPVKHGHWIFTGRTYKCSNCCFKDDNAVETDLCDMQLVNFKYCPNCGARMDGDTND